MVLIHVRTILFSKGPMESGGVVKLANTVGLNPTGESLVGANPSAPTIDINKRIAQFTPEEIQYLLERATQLLEQYRGRTRT